MAVLKNLRNLSEMEFYKNAIGIRRDVTLWMLKEFGLKRNPKSVTRVVKGISEKDADTINSIYENYGYNPNKAYETEYPQWSVDFEKEVLMKIMQEMVQNITQANSIYPTAKTPYEWDLRREYQDKAIGNCYSLTQEIQYITTIFASDLNKLPKLLDEIEREVELLKGWRRSDNQRKK